MEKNKQKLLRILEIIRETDENNPVTANQIIEKLKLYGIDAERKSVLRGISALNECGYDIVLHSDNKLGYYLASRDFEDWELKILIDAAASAKFLTERETNDLINRIAALGSKNGSKTLKALTAVSGVIKNNNPSTKIYIDRVIKAISASRQINFKYSFTDIDLNKKLKREGYTYTVNPYSLYWRSEHYYLIGNTPPHNDLSVYRLDRMRGLEIAESAILPAEEILGKNADLKIKEYIRDTVYNYGGKAVTLRLKITENAVDDLVDYFGANFRDSKDEDGLIATVRTTESEGLYRFLLQYGECVTVISPENIRAEMKERLDRIRGNYC